MTESAFTFTLKYYIIIVEKWKTTYEKKETEEPSPCLDDQGTDPICWAVCKIMVEDFRNGRISTNDEAIERAKRLSVSIYGVVCGGNPTNITYFDDVSLENLYLMLQTYGPLYVGYGIYENGERVTGHAIILTGVSLTFGWIYTNNPSGIEGEQTHKEFLSTFVGAGDLECKLEGCYYFYWG